MYVERHKLNDALREDEEEYDVSTECQFAVLDIINEDIEKIEKLCMQYDKDMPTEFKLIYDIQKNSLKAEYKYDLIHSNDPVKTGDDIAMEWFQEIKS